jgi:hypothetical protein
MLDVRISWKAHRQLEAMGILSLVSRIGLRGGDSDDPSAAAAVPGGRRRNRQHDVYVMKRDMHPSRAGIVVRPRRNRAAASRAL